MQLQHVSNPILEIRSLFPALSGAEDLPSPVTGILLLKSAL